MAVTSTLYATSATQVAGTWTNPTSATGAPDATGTTAPTNCATWVNAARSTTATLELSGYNFQSAIGASDTITSVSAVIPHAETSTANITGLTAQLYSGATAIGAAVTMTRVTSLTSHTVTFPTAPTYAQLSDLRVRITATRANNTTSSTEYIDAAGLAVTYTPVTAVTLPYTQTWTGTDGASWPAEWIPNGGTVTIQSGTGQMTTPTGGYDGALALLAGMPATADVEALVDVTALTAGVEQYPEIVLRGGTTRSGARPTTGYSLFLCYAATASSGFVQVERQNAGTTILGGPAFTFTGGVTYRVRFRVVGADLSVKIWEAASAEPGAWTWTYTDTSPYLTAGQVWLAHGNGADGIARSAQYDNLTVAVPSAGEVHTTTGRVTGTGTATGATTSTRTKTGTATATATTTRTGSSTRAKTGTATGTAAATRTGASVRANTGTASATATATGVSFTFVETHATAGTATATAAASSATGSTRTQAGTATATATASAVDQATRSVTAAATTRAAATSSTATTRSTTGTAAARSTASAVARTQRGGQAYASATATADGVSASLRLYAATALARAIATGTSRQGSPFRDIEVAWGPLTTRTLSGELTTRTLTGTATTRTFNGTLTARTTTGTVTARTLTGDIKEPAWT